MIYKYNYAEFKFYAGRQNSTHSVGILCAISIYSYCASIQCVSGETSEWRSMCPSMCLAIGLIKYMYIHPDMC